MLGPSPPRQTPWPPQNQIIFTGTPLRLRILWLAIASLSGKTVSALPCSSSVGTRILSTSGPTPRERKNATVWSEKRPVDAPSTSAWLICGFSPPVCGPAGLVTPPVTAVCPAPPRTEPQPCLTEPSLYSAVSSECQAIVGVIASTRLSMPAVTSWIAPP